MATKRQSPGKALSAAGAVRRTNLRQLVGIGRRFATAVQLASVLGVSESRLSQIIGRNPSRRMTESTARKYEYLLGLPVGALDRGARA